MSALVVVVLLAVVGGLFLATRGGDSDVELTGSQREDALLTEGDIGEGFTEADDTGSDDSDGDEPNVSGECEDLLDELDDAGENPFSDADDPPGSVTRTFNDEDSATIEHSLGPDDGLVGRYQDLVDVCDELTFDDDTGAGTVELSEGDEVDLGSESIAVDVAFAFDDGSGGTIETSGRILLWSRSGNASILVISDGIEFGDDGTTTSIPFDEDLLDDIAARADERLEEVIDEA